MLSTCASRDMPRNEMLTVEALCTDIMITDLDPGLRLFWSRALYSGVSNSYTVPEMLVVSLDVTLYPAWHVGVIPVPQSLVILGGPSNALKSTVIRPFSRI